MNRTLAKPPEADLETYWRKSIERIRNEGLTDRPLRVPNNIADAWTNAAVRCAEGAEPLQHTIRVPGFLLQRRHAAELPGLVHFDVGVERTQRFITDVNRPGLIEMEVDKHGGSLESKKKRGSNHPYVKTIISNFNGPATLLPLRSLRTEPDRKRHIRYSRYRVLDRRARKRHSKP